MCSYVQDGIYKEAMEDMKVLVVREISHTLEDKNSRVALVVNKHFCHNTCSMKMEIIF